MADDVVRVTSPQQLADVLAARRVALGLPLRVVAERTGQHLQNVSVALLGGQEPRVSTLLRLTAALGYDLALIPRDTEEGK